MESLLDAADALARGGGTTPERPDFPIPEEYIHVAPQPQQQAETVMAQNVDGGETDQQYNNNENYYDGGPQYMNPYLVLRDTADRGRGWFAKQNIPVGTLIMIEKPIEMVMDWQDDGFQVMDVEGDDDDDDDDDENDEENEPRLNELLMVKILERLMVEPTLWDRSLRHLFPRDEGDLSALPTWVCADDTIFMRVETLIMELKRIPELGGGTTNAAATEISRRLPHIIRYNILSVETCPELLSYPGPEGHSTLSGIALYHGPSFFNHSSRPNCNRWSIGDVMGFVTNRYISKDEEVCISYIEHDVLCESSYRRNLMLRMDFDDGGGQQTQRHIVTTSSSAASGVPVVAAASGNGDEDQQQQRHHHNNNNNSHGAVAGTVVDDDMVVVVSQAEQEGPQLPVVDSDVQNELMSMDPFERLSAIDELMQQATGARLPADGESSSSQQHHQEEEPLEGETMHTTATTNTAAYGVLNMNDDMETTTTVASTITASTSGGPLHSTSTSTMTTSLSSVAQNHHHLPGRSASGNTDPAATTRRATATYWFQCDIHNLRILKAITLDGLGRTRDALRLWEESVTFCETMLPSNDESCVVLHIQAALCALCANDVRNAQHHAQRALHIHSLLFGGGVHRFRRRCKRDLSLPIRPTNRSTNNNSLTADHDSSGSSGGIIIHGDDENDDTDNNHQKMMTMMMMTTSQNNDDGSGYFNDQHNSNSNSSSFVSPIDRLWPLSS